MSESEDDRPNSSTWRSAAKTATTLVLGLWCLNWLAMAWFFPDAQSRGLAGDAFGALNLRAEGLALQLELLALKKNRHNDATHGEAREQGVIAFCALADRRISSYRELPWSKY